MPSVKSHFSTLYEKYKHFLLLFYFVIYLAWFHYIESSVTSHFHVIHTRLDDLIPFCEYFVVPYFLWFLYVAWGFLYFGFHNRKDFYRMCTFLYTGMTIFLIISTIYPNGHYLRPYVFERDNIFTRLCAFLYSTDTATNLFPSIHVYNSVGIHLSVVKSERFCNDKKAKTISFLLMFSIILSTMFIKQHSTFDVMTALLLCAVMYRVVYMRDGAKLPRLSQRAAKSGGRLGKRLTQS
jgi:hypothetical protein